MMTIRKSLRVSAVSGLALLGVGCAPSGYSLELRNNVSENIRVEVWAVKGEERTLAASSPMGPGNNVTLFTRADRDADVQAEARVQGDDKSPPAVKKISVGLNRLTVNSNPESAKDASKPKLKIVERRD